MSDEFTESVRMLATCIDGINATLYMLAQRIDLLTAAMQEAGVPVFDKSGQHTQSEGD